MTLHLLNNTRDNIMSVELLEFITGYALVSSIIIILCATAGVINYRTTGTFSSPINKTESWVMLIGAAVLWLPILIALGYFALGLSLIKD